MPAKPYQYQCSDGWSGMRLGAEALALQGKSVSSAAVDASSQGSWRSLTCCARKPTL